MKLTEILLKPREAFVRIHKEKGLKQTSIFLVSLVLFVLLFLTYSYLTQINAYLSAMGFGITITPKVYIISYLGLSIFFIGMAYLRYWIIHWFVRLFKGPYGYAETCKALVYGRAPEYFSAPLFLGIVLLMPLRNQYLWLIVLLGLLFVGISLYQVVLRTGALAEFQKLSKTKAFLSIYVLGFVVQLLILVVIEFLLLIPVVLLLR
ncbi:MAG: YIP1 family protein [Nanobdellota archaeon]